MSSREKYNNRINEYDPIIADANPKIEEEKIVESIQIIQKIAEKYEISYSYTNNTKTTVGKNDTEKLQKAYEILRKKYILFIKKMATKIAWPLAKQDKELINELTNEGLLGLYEAARRFDYKQNNKFTTYALGPKCFVWRYMIDFLKLQQNIVHLPANMVAAMSAIGKKKVADENTTLGKDVKRVKRYLTDLGSFVSIDKQNSEDETIDMPDNREPENNVNPEEIIKFLKTILKRQELEIISLKYGLKDGHEHTLEEIGDILRVSKQRVGQIKERAIGKLKKRKKEMLDNL